MSRREPPSKNLTPTSLTPPSTHQTPTTDTPMSEAPPMDPTSTTATTTTTTTTIHQGAATADRVYQAQRQERQQQNQQQQQHSAPDQGPLVTGMSSANAYPREHPPREPTPRQPTPGLYDNSPPDRPRLSSYPTAPDSLPPTPHPGMSAPSIPRAHTGTPADRGPHPSTSSYPTAPATASQTPQSGRSQTPQQSMSAAGWLVPRAASPSSRISFEDYLSLSEITFEWGDSYDDKDWMRLRAILAPTLMIDYSQVNGHVWSSMPAEEFVRVMSHIGFVGDPLVHTQHHIGASKWSKISDDEAIGDHQLRAAHQRYTALDLKTVESKGHGHAMVKHFYRKVDGEWKLAGLRPTRLWTWSTGGTNTAGDPREKDQSGPQGMPLDVPQIASQNKSRNMPDPPSTCGEPP